MDYAIMRANLRDRRTENSNLKRSQTVTVGCGIEVGGSTKNQKSYVVLLFIVVHNLVRLITINLSI